MRDSLVPLSVPLDSLTCLSGSLLAEGQGADAEGLGLGLGLARPLGAGSDSGSGKDGTRTRDKDRDKGKGRGRGDSKEKQKQLRALEGIVLVSTPPRDGEGGDVTGAGSVLATSTSNSTTSSTSTSTSANTSTNTSIKLSTRIGEAFRAALTPSRRRDSTRPPAAHAPPPSLSLELQWLF